MLPRAAIIGALILSVSCNKSESSDVIGSAPSSGSGSAAKPGAGGSFSADLARELGSGGGAPAGNAGMKAGSEPAKAGSDAVAMAGSATRPDPVAPPPKVGAPASAPSTAPEAHGPVRVPADLAAIKISLLPNWDRDVEEAGTFQYVVRIKGTQATKTFSFHYGYDDPKAPNDREQYKKYLQESKLLMGEIKDRQRGAAWFLEGTDASGLPAFRYLVLYGGKHLICYGSLYKDGDSNRLGDDRDQTVIQAKQICETLAL